MINTRLFDWYGIDVKKNLQIKTRCSKPFDTVLINKNGSCYLCECTSWLPQSVGNLNLQSLDTILQSQTAKILQDSIIDNSYAFCNNKQCSYLLDNAQLAWPETAPTKQIKNIRLAIDQSCNLSCPSCRNRLIFDKDKIQLKRKFKIVDKIIQYISQQSHNITIHIGSDGDPFASLVYRYFMDQTKNLSNVKFTIQTNGLLIKKKYERFQYLFKNLNVLNISVDGATKKTYEKLRRGGSWEKIIENFNFIKSIKKNFKIYVHMVVQQENWTEMPLMLNFGKKYNVDKIFFNKIQNWNTELDYSKQTFFQDPKFINLSKTISLDPLSSVATLL